MGHRSHESQLLTFMTKVKENSSKDVITVYGRKFRHLLVPSYRDVHYLRAYPPTRSSYAFHFISKSYTAWPCCFYRPHIRIRSLASSGSKNRPRRG
jgi:hypothetical protein